MKRVKKIISRYCLALVAGLCFFISNLSADQLVEALQQEIAELEQKLAAAHAALSTAQQREKEVQQEVSDSNTLAPAEKITSDDSVSFLEGLTIGGAMRVNFTLGDYVQSPSTSATRGGSGTVALDTFRINLDYERGAWIGKGEYRFYPGYGANNADSYHFIHTLWAGYNFTSGDQLQVGLNRAPFGPGPYGVSQSWFFDQHYYVGLSDNMNIGLKYTLNQIENWTFDFAYYALPTPTGSGNNFGRQSVRYSYDVVDETGLGYEESHQFNARGIYSTQFGEVTADLGASLQYGILESNGLQGNGDMFAASIHGVFSRNNWKLSSQLTYYNYDVDYQDAAGNTLTRDVVTMGAYDFPTEVAAKAWIPAVSLSYLYETTTIAWLDYILPYVEYSSIVKQKSGFNNSDMFIIGSAWARGSWYIYSDLVFSNGNDFVGNREVSAPSNFGATGGFTSQFGENANDSWQTRFNINFGYYF